jgi:hypothetical protein
MEWPTESYVEVSILHRRSPGATGKQRGRQSEVVIATIDHSDIRECGYPYLPIPQTLGASPVRSSRPANAWPVRIEEPLDVRGSGA